MAEAAAEAKRVGDAVRRLETEEARLASEIATFVAAESRATAAVDEKMRLLERTRRAAEAKEGLAAERAAELRRGLKALDDAEARIATSAVRAARGGG